MQRLGGTWKVCLGLATMVATGVAVLVPTASAAGPTSQLPTYRPYPVAAPAKGYGSAPTRAPQGTTGIPVPEAAGGPQPGATMALPSTAGATVISTTAGTPVTTGASVLAAPSSAVQGSDPAPGVVVKLAPGVDVAAITARYKLQAVRTILASRGIYLFDGIGTPSKDDRHRLADTLHKDRDVVYAEVEVPGDLEDDSNFHAWVDGRWADAGTDPRAWSAQPGLSYLDLDGVHSVSVGSGVRVAVLDSGVDLSHSLLSGHLASGGYDYVDDDAVPADDPGRSRDGGEAQVGRAFGHGTHVAGLIALMAPKAIIVPYRVLDPAGAGDFHVVAEAVNDAVASGAKVINMSFGTTGNLKSKVLRDALQRAVDSGVVVVAAAGNDASRAVYSPAAVPDVVGVAATATDNRTIAGFSNVGHGAFVAAPGQSIVSTVPGGGLGSWSGTSMSAAIVSGEAALLLSNNPRLGRKALTEVIGRSTIKLSGPVHAKHGLVDVWAALRAH